MKALLYLVGGAAVQVTFWWLTLPTVVAVRIGHLGDACVLVTFWCVTFPPVLV